MPSVSSISPWFKIVSHVPTIRAILHVRRRCRLWVQVQTTCVIFIITLVMLCLQLGCTRWRHETLPLLLNRNSRNNTFSYNYMKFSITRASENLERLTGDGRSPLSSTNIADGGEGEIIHVSSRLIGSVPNRSPQWGHR